MNSITKIGDNTRGEVLSEVIEMLLNLVKDKVIVQYTIETLWINM